MLKKIREIYNNSKFSRNTAPKILSIVFAIVFWIFVMDQVNPEMIRQLEDIPVQLIGVEELKSKNYEIMGEREFVVDVTFKGRRNEVIKLTKSDIEITADIGDLTSGDQTVLLGKKISVEDIFIEETSRDTVTLDIDEIIREPIDVQIIKQGNVPEGYMTEEMTLSLQQVFVKGPESLVGAVDSVRGIININNATTEISKDVAVEAIDNNGETVTGVEVETNYISVEIPISKIADIAIQPITTGEVKQGYGLTEIIVLPDVVNVRGQREAINALKFIETKDINLSGVSASFEIYTELNVPDDIEMNQYLDEVKVSVTIEEIITTEFTYEYSDITFLNKASNLRTNINELEGVVLLRVTAFESIANNITKNDLTLYIDAEDFESGIINAEVLLNQHNEFTGIEISPSNIKIEVIDIDATD
ncbi:MAG: hypothetical protein JEZ08_21105 [Clostridiales bacterium]|nr:hypothetical protein [Clostridiales bacterium]